MLSLNFKWEYKILYLNGVPIAQMNYDRGRYIPVFLNGPENIFNKLPQPDFTEPDQVTSHIESAFRSWIKNVTKENDGPE